MRLPDPSIQVQGLLGPPMAPETGTIEGSRGQGQIGATEAP